MDHTATHDNSTLHHAATRCNTLQDTATHRNTLQHTATHCNTLQYTATHCNNILKQHTATHYNTLCQSKSIAPVYKIARLYRILTNTNHDSQLAYYFFKIKIFSESLSISGYARTHAHQCVYDGIRGEVHPPTPFLLLSAYSFLQK